MIEDLEGVLMRELSCALADQDAERERDRVTYDVKLLASRVISVIDRRADGVAAWDRSLAQQLRAHICQFK